VSRFADAAYEWLLAHAPPEGTTTKEMWEGLELTVPELTTPSDKRKTPYNTLIRDMRLDRFGRFEIDHGRVKLRHRDRVK
jgi:hypothetical protein